MKRCRRCDVELPLTAFRRSRDWYRSDCKECEKAHNRQQYAENPEFYRAKQREWYTTRSAELLAKTRARYRADVEHGRALLRTSYRERYRKLPEPFKEAVRRYQAKNPFARQVRHAIETGRLVRPSTCSNCGAEGKIQAHHPDYSRPFDVVWLCTFCHRHEHQRLREQQVAVAMEEVQS